MAMTATFENTLAFARSADMEDPLRALRDEFIFPEKDGKPIIYFTGNSLGLQPKSAAAFIKQELDDWARYGVEGHHKAKRAWYPYHEFFSDSLGRLVGAKPSEVVAMNGLTVNVHLMLVSFYRPAGKRTKILCEQRPFPSDRYAMASQIEFHGLDPNVDLVEMKPRAGEHILHTEDIVQKIQELGEELALVHFGGVNFLTGQAFDMKSITESGHRAGARVGFDLAHAAGNLVMHLHDWNVDFATWCGYKYLNSGPGAVAGAFVHERHHTNDLPRFAGWWGHNKEERFNMDPVFKPIPTVEAWQLSNAPVFPMAIHRAALDLFDRAGMPALRAKSEQLTGFLKLMLNEISVEHGGLFQIITPSEPTQRGCQLSLLVRDGGRKIFDALIARGVLVDWREPNPGSEAGAGVLRLAPVPLYNSFEDVYRFGEVLNDCVRT